mmetsp:Transcript_6939/g.14748  ORF Transcript_6939/g.14748 Transcript_6939/m.14748 type:complete len:95 (-) Transcript_6939:19-303(-)
MIDSFIRFTWKIGNETREDLLLNERTKTSIDAFLRNSDTFPVLNGIHRRRIIRCCKFKVDRLLYWYEYCHYALERYKHQFEAIMLVSNILFSRF